MNNRPSKVQTHLYPVLYQGPQPNKRQHIPGSNNELAFRPASSDECRCEPEPEAPCVCQIAMATEKECGWISKVCPDLYRFPEGWHTEGDTTVLRATVADLQERLLKLEEIVQALTTDKPRRGKATAPELMAV